MTPSFACGTMARLDRSQHDSPNSRRDRCSKRLQMVFHASSRGVDHNALPIPWMVLACHDFRPCRRLQSWSICRSRLYTASVFGLIRANDLHLDACDLRPIRDVNPGLARDRQRIHRIGNDGVTEAQVVLSDRIRGAIPGIVERCYDYS